MTIRLSIKDVRANLSELIGSVFSTREPGIVEREGRPMAVLNSPEQFEGYVQYIKTRFNDAAEELRRRNASEDPGEVHRDVTKIVERVRQEQYARGQWRAAD